MADGVGNKLRTARARRKLSLAECEEATKIRSRYLAAMESESWDELPDDVYARAFLRTYAALLGLDGDRLAEEQRRDRGGSRPGERLPRVDPRPRRVAARRRRPLPSWLITVLVLALVVGALIAVLVIGGSGGGGGETTRPQAPPPRVGQAVPVR